MHSTAATKPWRALRGSFFYTLHITHYTKIFDFFAYVIFLLYLCRGFDMNTIFIVLPILTLLMNLILLAYVGITKIQK